MSKTWQGRIDVSADPLFEEFTSSVVHDRRIALHDVTTSRAHARALARAGIVSSDDADRLVQALDEIAEDMKSGTFVWRVELEDVHTHVEARLREKLGTLADALHAGRSRNDQIATDLRLYVKEIIGASMGAILDLQDGLLGLAEVCGTSLMPGYTHLQQAQPVLIAQPLLAYVAMLGRDWERLRDGLSRTDRSPLGCGALTGSNFELDRDFLAEECGFAGIVTNSMDGVSDRDFLIEFVFAAALCMTHLSRLSEDLIIWSSQEFGFVLLPDSFASGSSMMPQKKNPDVLELIRGKAALVIGDLTGALALVKGIPLGYDGDLQEHKTPLYHAADTLLSTLEILAAMVPRLSFDTERTERAISSFALATDLADALVQTGVPFREAHGIIAGIVARTISEAKELTSVDVAIPQLPETPELTPSASVRRKRTAGSTSPEEVQRQMASARTEIADRRQLRENSE